MRSLLGYLLLAPFILIGCKSGGSEDPIANSVGGYCGIDVVSDYNTVVHNCNMNGKSSSACSNSRDSFLAKYPGINCTAGMSNSNSVDDSQFSITESYVRSTFTSYSTTTSTSSGSSSTTTVRYKNGENCSQVVIDSYNNDVVLRCRSLSTSEEVSAYKNCKGGIEKFTSQYPGVYCRATNYETYMYISETELLETKNSVEELLKLKEYLEQLKGNTSAGSAEGAEI